MIDTFSTITSELVHKGKRIIGINGVDCAGKTIFAKSYADYLTLQGIKNQIIHIDDFTNPRKIRDNGDYYETATDYAMLINEILEPLKSNGNINKEIVCLNIDTDKYENKRRYQIDNETVVLIEGFLLFRPPVLEYLDGKIFLHVDFDEVIRRTTIRDVPKYGEQFIGLYNDLFIPTQKRYLSEFEPQKNCDIFINNSDYNNPVLIKKTPGKDYTDV